jgi:uncharacterized damage-inducible protein DinB
MDRGAAGARVDFVVMNYRIAIPLFAIACMAQAQTAPAAPADLIVTNARQSWGNLKYFVLRAAEKMPEDQYAYRPTAEVRSFGQLIWHVARLEYFVCAAVKGAPQPEAVPAKTAKADLIAALQESYASCDPVFEGLTAANAGEALTMYGQSRARVAALFMLGIHVSEHYGNMVTYLRLKGIVPPSSEPRK